VTDRKVPEDDQPWVCAADPGHRLAGLLGTEGVAWDIAWPAVFLASEESRWITGIEALHDIHSPAPQPEHK